MYSYNNSYLDNFKHNIRTGAVGENKVPASAGGDSVSESSQTLMPNVTPDYNVSLPGGYTKLGVEKLSNGQEIHCYKLNNGQKVYIAPKENSKTVLNTYVNTGSMNEKDDERGISHFCEHMAFNGTFGNNGYMKLGIGDVFRKVGDMGGFTNASTNFAETNYIISIPQFEKDDFETIVKMQSSMMNNLEMTPEMVEKEYGPVTSEINMYNDMADTIAMNTAVKNLYNIDTKSPDLVAGTVENILNIDSNKVMQYYKNNYFPANMSTVVTGDVVPDQAIEVIAKHFKGENPNNPERRLEPLNRIESPVRKDMISDKAVGTTGVLCFEGPANNDAKANIELFALNHLLFNKKHSRVTAALEPYNVEVRAGVEKLRTLPSDPEFLSLTYTTTDDNSEPALKSIYDIITNFTPPTPEEMESLKTGLKMRYEQKYDNMESLNFLIGSTSLSGGIDECVKAIDIIDNMTADDLVNACKKYYDLNKVSIAVIHPEKVSADSIKLNHDKAKSLTFKGSHIEDKMSKRPLDTSKAEVFSLNNNCEVALMNTDNNIASFSAHITDKVPANIKPGVMEVLEQIMTRGNDEMVRLVDKNNITSYSGVGSGSAFFDVEVPPKNLPIAMRIMKNALLTPDFSQKTFEKAKHDVKTELLTRQPDAFDNAKKVLFPDSPSGYNRKDILDNIDNVTLEEVMGLHQYITQKGSMTFAASLPMEKYPEIRHVVMHELEQMPVFEPNKPEIFNDYQHIQKSKVVKEVANTAQADVVQAYKFDMGHDPRDVAAFTVMNLILDRGDETGLFNNLREKEKLAYRVSSELIKSQMRSGVLLCGISTTTDSQDLKSYDNVKKSIEGFHRQINKVVNGEFTDKELEVAKLGFKRQLLDLCEGQENMVLSASAGLNSVNGIENYNKQYEMIDTLSKEDIQRVARHIFSTKPVYSIRASKDTLTANEEFLNSLEG